VSASSTVEYVRFDPLIAMRSGVKPDSLCTIGANADAQITDVSSAKSYEDAACDAVREFVEPSWMTAELAPARAAAAAERARRQYYPPVKLTAEDIARARKR